MHNKGLQETKGQVSFVIFLLGLSALCFLSLAFAFGYDEGTMNNDVVGKIALVLLSIFKFPFRNLFPDGDFIVCLFSSVLLYSVFGSLLLLLFGKRKKI